jgi:hypothetical protein
MHCWAQHCAVNGGDQEKETTGVVDLTYMKMYAVVEKFMPGVAGNARFEARPLAPASLGFFSLSSLGQTCISGSSDEPYRCTGSSPR